MRTRASLVILTILVLCASCTEPTVPPTPVPTPSPTPEPKILTVCLPDEPDSLYLYGDDSLAAQHIWQAIYDGPLDSRTYTHQPVILTELPSLAHGSAAVETVTVQAGDRVLDARGELVELAPGVTVEDAGGKRATFDGDPVLMQRMVITFTLRADLYWSDGAPLTADDAVFSFELAADPATPTNKHAIARTTSYRAVDARTVVWSGAPGFLDHFYYLNFWRPLPRHAWGSVPAADLLTAEGSTRRPLGWGPFLIREWVVGDHLTVVRNPLYFRASEGLPRLDEVTFRFIPDPTTLAEELLAGRCDLVTHEAADAVHAALPNQPPIETFAAPDSRWELLAFGISPAQGYDRPDFFEDVRVRQGIALCIDRQAIAEQVLGVSGRVLDSYLPPEHPLHAGGALTTWAYDPAAGQALLAAAGWQDEDGDSVREAHNIPGVATGAPFQVTYHTTGDPLRVQVGQLVRSHLTACGM